MLMVPFLFIAGVVFAYYMVLPNAISFLQNFNDDNFDILLQARDYYRFSIMVLIAMGLAVPGAGRDPRRHARGDRHAARSCARTAATRSSSSRSSRCCCPGQDPVTMLLADAPAARALRGLYPVGSAARPARCARTRSRGGRRALRRRRPRLTTDSTMLFDLRGSGRRRTVKIVYITLAFLMGGGLVLFGIGGGGGISGGLVDAITGHQRRRRHQRRPLHASRRRRRCAKTQANPQDAAAWAALARARFQLAGSGDELRRREVAPSPRGQRAAQQRRRRLGAATSR